jgi:hypothetical protein
MFIGQPCRDTPSRSAIQKTDLDEEGLVDFLQSILFFRQAGCQGIQPDRASVVFLDNGEQKPAIQVVEAVGVYPVQL